MNGQPLRLNALEPDDPGLSADPIAKLYDALVAGVPPGKLILMLEGDRPVVSLAVWRLAKSVSTTDIVTAMKDVGERIDAVTWVLWPLDVTRKLASESEVLAFDFPDMTERKWKC